MATQNMGLAYKKLAELWDKKRGPTRDYTSNIFQNTTHKEPVYHVAKIVNSELCRIHKNTTTTIVDELKNIEPNAVMVNEAGIWIYDMRHTDAAPRTEQDTTRLKWFVSLFIKKHFDTSTQYYLNENFTITMCFFVWFFTTPDYFYATKEMRQTTRYGIQKIWTETLLRKKPTTTPPPTAKLIKHRGMMHQKNVLPKLEEETRALQTKMDALVSNSDSLQHGGSSGGGFDWTADARQLHKQISECLDTNSVHYISTKKSKKLQTMYQDYQKLQEKLARTKQGISHAEFQEKQGNVVFAKKPEPKHIEAKHVEAEHVEAEHVEAEHVEAEHVEAEHVEAEHVEAEHVEAEHVEAKDIEEEQEVPESWEDLME
jgi:DNA-binding protein YbaB